MQWVSLLQALSATCAKRTTSFKAPVHLKRNRRMTGMMSFQTKSGQLIRIICFEIQVKLVVLYFFLHCNSNTMSTQDASTTMRIKTLTHFYQRSSLHWMLCDNNILMRDPVYTGCFLAWHDGTQQIPNSKPMPCFSIPSVCATSHMKEKWICNVFCTASVHGVKGTQKLIKSISE